MIFLDTGYIIALEAADDQNHEAALRHWVLFSKNLPLVFTTSYVFDEVVTFFNNRGHHPKSVEIGNNLLKSCQGKIEMSGFRQNRNVRFS